MLASVSCLVSPRKGDAPLSLHKPERRISWKNKQQKSPNEITVTVEYTLRTFVALVLKQLCHVGKNSQLWLTTAVVMSQTCLESL